MRNHPHTLLGWAALVLVLAALACSGTATGTPTAERPTSMVVLVTATPPATLTPLPGGLTPVPQMTPTPGPGSNCALNMAYVADVTIPDGTVLAPGSAFAKTWRVKNIGTCDWKAGTQLVFAEGSQMNGPIAVDVPETAANATADISVNLKAPSAPGNYSGRWRMRSPDGTIYGSLTVVINVPGTPTVTASPSPTATETPSALAELYNLHDKANTAGWTANGGALTFPGSSGDNQGFAMFQDGQKLEDGATYNRVLETHPAWVTGGFIQGVYTVGDIKAGDRFRARLGLLYGASVTEGNVTYIIKGGNGVTVGTFGKKRDGTIINVDLDLSPLAGQTNQIILRVEANNANGDQDWACWANPRIVGKR